MTDDEITMMPEGQAETWRAYYLLQYQRVSQHESQRMQMTSAVVAGSAVGFGIVGLPAGGNSWVGYAVLVTIALANLMACVSVANARKWVKIHQTRAAAALKLLSPELLKLQTSVNRNGGVAGSAKDRRAFWRGPNLLIGIHLALIALSAALMFSQRLG